MFRVVVSTALLGLVVCLSGCSSSCKAGAVEDCSCPAGGTGTHTCQADGTFGDCGSCHLMCGDTDCGYKTKNVTSITCNGGTCGYEACLPGFSDCDGNPVNGCETELATRCANMNATGVFCADNACNYASCVAGQNDCDGNRANGCEYLGSSCPEAVASGQNRVLAIAVDTDSVYFSREEPDGGGDVMKVSKAGGAPTVLVPATQAGRIAVDATSVYWSTGSTLQRVSKSGGTPQLLASGQNYVHSNLALDSSFVYWGAYPDSTVMKVPIAGGTPVLLASNQYGPDAVALDDSYVYWANGFQGDLMKVAKGGGTPIPLATSLGGSDSIAVDSTGIYFASYDTSHVYAFDKNGGSQRAFDAGIGPSDLVLDNGFIYWAQNNGTAGTGTIVRLPEDGGTSVTIASQQDGPNALVVDDTFVYWIAYPDDTIWRALK